MQSTSPPPAAIDARAAGAVHDFNNLLSVIMVCADEIAAMPGEGEHRERAMEIRAAASHGAELIRGLLAGETQTEPTGACGPADATSTAADDLRNREAAGEEVRIMRSPEESGLRAIDVAKGIDDCLPLLERALGPEAKVRSNADAQLPPAHLPADALERILLNLAANSRAAFESAEVASRSVVIQSSLVAVRDGDPLLDSGWYVRVAFSDNGGGMDFEVAARALEPGFSTKSGDGTGLGLSIVRQIVREASGDVRLNTTPGVGTTITLYVPAATTAAGGAGLPVADPESGGR